MSDPAVIAALPGLLAATRASVEANAPTHGLPGVMRATLIGWLLLAESTAEQLAALVPAARAAQQQFHAPLGERPRVPRFADGEAARPGTGLPPGRPHP